MIKDLIYGLLLAAIIASFPVLVFISLDKEAERQEQVFDYRCDAYGYAINKHYGREVCPPTPNG